MKKLVLLVIASVGLGPFASADLRLPGSIFTMDDLDQAMQKAAEKEQPLIFVYTNPESTDEDCLDASEKAFAAFRNVGVVIFANAKTLVKSDFPEGVKMNWMEGGGNVPRVYVTTADGAQGIDGISTGPLRWKLDEVVRYLEEELDKIDVLAGGAAGTITDTGHHTAASTATATTGSGLFAETQEWTNAEGQTITAAIRKVEGDQVEFLMAGGRTIMYPMAKLSAESRERIEEMRPD